MSRFVLLLLTLALTAAAAPEAAACSCVARPACQLLADADAVFVGEITGVDDDGRQKVATLRVSHVYKGALEPGATIQVHVGWGTSASCALDVFTGQRWVMYATAGRAGWSSGLCHGSHPAAPGKQLPAPPPGPCVRPSPGAR